LIAADDAIPHSTGIAAGEPIARTWLVPVADFHGYRDGDTRTLCGKRVSALVSFADDRFPAANPDLNCDLCTAALEIFG
jgi:hypothetical protein